MSLAATLYSFVAVPVVVCFSGSASSTSDSIVEVTLEVLLLAGVISPFIGGIENPEKKSELIRSWAEILKEYRRGLLVTDLVASCPWYSIWLLTEKSVEAFRVLSLCRLLKLPGLMVGRFHAHSIQKFQPPLLRAIRVHPNMLRATRLIVFFFLRRSSGGMWVLFRGKGFQTQW